MKIGTGTLTVLALSACGIVTNHTPAWAWTQNGLSFSTPVSPARLVINADQFQGKWKQFKGELKKKWGNFTDDDLLFIEGRRDKLDGKIQERYGDRKEEVKKWNGWTIGSSRTKRLRDLNCSPDIRKETR